MAIGVLSTRIPVALHTVKYLPMPMHVKSVLYIPCNSFSMRGLNAGSCTVHVHHCSNNGDENVYMVPGTVLYISMCTHANIRPAHDEVFRYTCKNDW
jgi:hypothetical protein